MELTHFFPRPLGLAVPPAHGGQQAVRARLPSLPARRSFMERALTGEAAELALNGRQAEAEAVFARMLSTQDWR